jgi:hypothetical protein
MPTTAELAEHLLQTAPDYAGWSIVESPNSAGYYDELLEWAASMNIVSWKVDRRLRPHELGLVILWLECEAARRHGGEGSLWPVLSNRDIVPWHDTVHAKLFSPAGAALPEHRDLLKNCAHEYGLRHTFDDQEGQNWYRLISLQFGFTREDASKRLALWLSGQLPPISVQRLLENDDPGAKAFQQVWRSLRMFRLGNLPKSTLESRLLSNPWVLPAWCKELVDAAKKSSAQIIEVADLDAAHLSFFTSQRLAVTETGQPYFTTSLCNLTELKLDADEYELKAGEQVLARLIKQPDGSYYSDAPERIRLPLQPNVSLSLIGKDGKIAGHDEAILWDTMEEVSVYSPKTGTVIPSGQKIRSGVELYLITSADISLRPEPVESFDLGLGYHVHLVARGWTGNLEACLDDDVIWSSNVSNHNETDSPIGVSARFTTSLDLRAGQHANSKPPWNLPLQIHIPHGWTFSRMRWRKCNGKRLEFDVVPPHLSLTEQDAVRPIVLRIRVSNGKIHRTDVVRVSVPFVAALKWTMDGRPYHHPPDRKLLLGDGTKYAWSFSLPSRNGEPRDPRKCSFVEGGTLHNRLKSRPSTLPELDGYGASLCIVDDPYGRDAAVMEVAPCVLDGGVLGNVTWDREVGGFHIRSSFKDLGPDHQLLAWHTGEAELSKISVIDRENLTEEEDGWLWNPSEHLHLHAVALFYRGVRLGSWFDFGSNSRIAIEKPPGSVPETAALLRAWKAPLLQEDGGHFSRYAEWLGQNWSVILPVWLSTGLLRGPDSMEWPAPSLSVDWLGLVAELLLAAMPMPTDESTGQLVELLAPHASGIEALNAAMFTILDVCPILAARITKCYLDEFASNSQKQLFHAQIPYVIANELSIINRNRFGNNANVAEDHQAEEIARSIGERDGYWLEQTIPSLHLIEHNGRAAISQAYRFLSKRKDYKLYALKRWLSEIR